MKTQITKQQNDLVAAIESGARKLIVSGILLGLLTGACFAQRGSRQATPIARPAPTMGTPAPNAKPVPASPGRSVSRKGDTTVQPAVRDKTTVQEPYCATHPQDCQVVVK